MAAMRNEAWTDQVPAIAGASLADSVVAAKAFVRLLVDFIACLVSTLCYALDDFCRNQALSVLQCFLQRIVSSTFDIVGACRAAVAVDAVQHCTLDAVGGKCSHVVRFEASLAATQGVHTILRDCVAHITECLSMRAIAATVIIATADHINSRIGSLGFAEDAYKAATLAPKSSGTRRSFDEALLDLRCRSHIA